MNNIFTVEEWKEIEDMQKKAQKKIEERERENKKKFVKRLRLKKEVKNYLDDLTLEIMQLITLFLLPWVVIMLYILVYC